LLDICSSGNFFRARDHFWGTCIERLNNKPNTRAFAVSDDLYDGNNDFSYHCEDCDYIEDREDDNVENDKDDSNCDGGCYNDDNDTDNEADGYYNDDYINNNGELEGNDDDDPTTSNTQREFEETEEVDAGEENSEAQGAERSGAITNTTSIYHRVRHPDKNVLREFHDMIMESSPHLLSTKDQPQLSPESKNILPEHQLAILNKKSATEHGADSHSNPQKTYVGLSNMQLFKSTPSKRYPENVSQNEVPFENDAPTQDDVSIQHDTHYKVDQTFKGEEYLSSTSSVLSSNDDIDIIILRPDDTMRRLKDEEVADLFSTIETVELRRTHHIDLLELQPSDLGER
jgi:hypothetical protein